MSTDAGPYKAIVTFKSKDQEASLPHPPLDVEVTRNLINMGVRFELLERMSRFKWVIICNKANDANNACSNDYVLKSNYSITIPWYFVSRKVIIKGVPADVSEEEIWQEISSSNKSYSFKRKDIYRLKIRKYEDGKVTYINSATVRLSIRSSTIPSHVIMWKTRMPMAPYIPSTRQCYNCGQLSHASKFCHNNTICLTCGEGKHNTLNPWFKRALLHQLRG